MAGANAIFTGEKMLTTPCSGWDEDKAMLGRWGLRGLRSFEDQESLDAPTKSDNVAESVRV
jgi:biotin synthase